MSLVSLVRRLTMRPRGVEWKKAMGADSSEVSSRE